MNLPERFTRIIKNLYKDAESVAIINGETSSPYKVNRGVRQGCPLSCLLFDLAIEPLAEMLRCSDLRGYKASGLPDRTVVTMFADDTTVYLSKQDNIDSLTQILDSWCRAAGAKFNIAKTEIIPIGSPQYRQQVIDTRKLHPEAQEIPLNMNIAKEKEAKRFLGAWIGNQTNQEGIWAPTLEKINSRLTRWEKTWPTIEGRRIIIQWIIGGMTQYLANAQGMPKSIERRLEKICNSLNGITKAEPP